MDLTDRTARELVRAYTRPETSADEVRAIDALLETVSVKTKLHLRRAWRTVTKERVMLGLENRRGK